MKPLLALAQHKFGALALGDINDAGENEGAIFSTDRIEPYLNWNFSSVLSKAVKLAAGAHRTSRGSAKETLAVARMRAPVAFGHQHLDWLLEQLTTVVPKERLSLRIR